MGSNFIDEIDCTNFFDQIEDLIEFPPDDECGAVGGYLAGSGDSKDIPSMWSDKLPDDGAIFSCGHADELSAELSVPYDDIAQLEWLSTFVEDSFSGGGMTLGKENLCTTNKSSPNQFQTSSPLSVLESSSSCSSSCGGKSKAVPPLSPSQRGPQRARSKRPRPATFSPRAAIQLISPSSSFVEATHPFMGSDSFADSPAKRIPQLAAAAGEPKKKKKIKATPPPSGPDQTHGPPSQEVRKCLHCEITKTPQWRAGPMGPKTLCNACGVRYKSGRLFPEYRPAASPTFVASVHSNSHKKVVEMRIKGATAVAPPIPAKPDSGCSI